MASFNPAGSGGLSPTVSISEPSNPTIANVTVVNANTEESYALPASTRQFRLAVRGSSRLQLSYLSGQSGTVYVTIWPGEEFESINFQAGALTALYFQTSKSNEVVEIESWA